MTTEERTYTIKRLCELTGMTVRRLDYLARQDGIDVPEPGSGHEREVGAVGSVQLVLFGMLGDVVEHRVAFMACRTVGDVVRTHGVDPLRGMFLVLKQGGVLAIVSHPEDVSGATATLCVVHLDDVLELVSAA